MTPSSWAAALYLARARYRVVVVEKKPLGGQITITAEVVNYPGVARTSGTALTEAMRQQAQSFGAGNSSGRGTGLADGRRYKNSAHHPGRSEMIWRAAWLPGTPAHGGLCREAEFRGRRWPIAPPATRLYRQGCVCGGRRLCRGGESVFLTKYTRHVTILLRKKRFHLRRGHPKITVLPNTGGTDDGRYGPAFPALAQHGHRRSDGYRPPQGETFGVFAFVGCEPATDLVRGPAELDVHGYVHTGRDQCAGMPGLYAASDVCAKPLRQVVTAVGEGALPPQSWRNMRRRCSRKRAFGRRRQKCCRAKTRHSTSPAAGPQAACSTRRCWLSWKLFFQNAAADCAAVVLAG